MKRLFTFAVIVGLFVACSKKETARTSDDKPADAEVDSGTGTALDGHALVVGACLSCHSEHMLAQQRLTEAQWSKVVTKMTGWGANLEPTETRTLVAYLAATYGPDAGAYEVEPVRGETALAELAATPDDPFPTGDAERGRALYESKCSGCHGADARGHIGVILIDRPFLYRAGDFAKTVRRGRGKMTPTPLTDSEVGDVLAHLRRLRNPAL